MNDANEKALNETGNRKKLSKYEIFRRIMLTVCIAALLVCTVLLIKYIVGHFEARKLSSVVIEGVANITRPEDYPSGSDPVQKDPSDENGNNEDEPQYSEYFLQYLTEIREVKKKYPDFIGYIRIDGLGILEPIVQGDDNDHYLKYLMNGVANPRGEIYMDYRNNSDDLRDNYNLVLYGHNMIDGTRFNKLLKYKEAENFYNCPIEIITEEGIFTFKLYSFYQTTASDTYSRRTFTSDSMFKVFCEGHRGMSMHKSDVEFTGKETILTLSTCVTYGSEKRWCAQAVLIDVSQ